MMRTSVLLPADLHQSLKLAAKAEKVSPSQLIRKILDKALVVREEARVKNAYKVFEKMEGIAKSNLTDASTTIDEVLYGEKGAWRGHK